MIHKSFSKNNIQYPMILLLTFLLSFFIKTSISFQFQLKPQAQFHPYYYQCHSSSFGKKKFKAIPSSSLLLKPTTTTTTTTTILQKKRESNSCDCPIIMHMYPYPRDEKKKKKKKKKIGWSCLQTFRRSSRLSSFLSNSMDIKNSYSKTGITSTFTIPSKGRLCFRRRRRRRLYRFMRRLCILVSFTFLIAILLQPRSAALASTLSQTTTATTATTATTTTATTATSSSLAAAATSTTSVAAATDAATGAVSTIIAPPAPLASPAPPAIPAPRQDLDFFFLSMFQPKTLGSFQILPTKADLELCFRLVFAAVTGACVGWDREREKKTFQQGQGQGQGQGRRLRLGLNRLGLLQRKRETKQMKKKKHHQHDDLHYEQQQQNQYQQQQQLYHDDTPAGIRTMALVSLGACAFTLCSIYGFAPLTFTSLPSSSSLTTSTTSALTSSALSSNIKVDPSRMASNVASGVGFIGAGVITNTRRIPTNSGNTNNNTNTDWLDLDLYPRKKVNGLTTAAAIWVAAAAGVASGVGLYFVSAISAMVTILILRAPKRNKVHHQYGNSNGTEISSRPIFQHSTVAPAIDNSKDDNLQVLTTLPSQTTITISDISNTPIQSTNDSQRTATTTTKTTAAKTAAKTAPTHKSDNIFQNDFDNLTQSSSSSSSTTTNIHNNNLPLEQILMNNSDQDHHDMMASVSSFLQEGMVVANMTSTTSTKSPTTKSSSSSPTKSTTTTTTTTTPLNNNSTNSYPSP